MVDCSNKTIIALSLLFLIVFLVAAFFLIAGHKKRERNDIAMGFLQTVYAQTPPISICGDISKGDVDAGKDLRVIECFIDKKMKDTKHTEEIITSLFTGRAKIDPDMAKCAAKYNCGGSSPPTPIPTPKPVKSLCKCTGTGTCTSANGFCSGQGTCTGGCVNIA